MYQIEYKSKNGSVVLGGGKSALFNITSVSGLELPPREYTTIEFAGENGTTVTGKKDIARTITIAGTLCGSQKDIEKACKVFYEDGELLCIFNNVRKKISCRMKTLDDFVRYGKSGLHSFAVQFVSDYPYFTDLYEHTAPIYSRRNLVTTEFTLPCVFTERITGGNLRNTGDKFVYPKIAIVCEGAGASSSATLEIVNATNGGYIGIEYAMSDGETIEIDIATRKITSSLKGNITNYITNDTDLSKFYLDVGDNEISFENSDTTQIITASAEFNPEYLTAVR